MVASSLTRRPVSVEALIRRINRKLKPYEQVLKVSRGARARSDLGTFYILDWRSNFIVDSHVDVAALARELGKMSDWEYAENE